LVQHWNVEDPRLIDYFTDELLLPARSYQLMPSTRCHHPVNSPRCSVRTSHHLPWRCCHQLHFPNSPWHLRNHHPEQRYQLRTGYLRNPHFVRLRGFSWPYRLFYHRRDELREIESTLNRCRTRRILREFSHPIRKRRPNTDSGFRIRLLKFQ